MKISIRGDGIVSIQLSGFGLWAGFSQCRVL